MKDKIENLKNEILEDPIISGKMNTIINKIKDYNLQRESLGLIKEEIEILQEEYSNLKKNI